MMADDPRLSIVEDPISDPDGYEESVTLRTLDAILASRSAKKIFDPDQPRDEQGQWSETGAGGTTSGPGLSKPRTGGGRPDQTKTWEEKILAGRSGQELVAAEVLPTQEELSNVEWFRNTYSRQCWEMSARYSMYNEIKGVELVHGTISVSGVPVAHGWVELPGGRLFDGTLQRFFDKEKYYAARGAVSVYRYNAEEILKETVRSGVWGPWAPINAIGGELEYGRRKR